MQRQALFDLYSTMVSFSPPPTAQATTHIGVHTPSTTPRANRLRQPLQSPFSSASVTTSLSDEQHNEIKVVFQIFDPTLSGYIDIPTFEIMVHSLGFRLTEDCIEQLVDAIVEERQQQQHAPDSNNYNRRQIDLSMATQILYQVGYDKRNMENEIQMYFEIFDGGRKGFITIQDLHRVQNEVHSFKSINVEDVINKETLQAMIEQFDENHDGVVDYDEFKNILKPILS